MLSFNPSLKAGVKIHSLIRALAQCPPYRTPKNPYLYRYEPMEKISETILKFLRLDSLIQNITGFVETRIELMKIEIREDVAKAVARGLMLGAFFLVGFLFLIFFSLGLANFLNTFFERPFMGYWIVTGGYAATFLILLASRKSVQSYFEAHMKEMMKRKEK